MDQIDFGAQQAAGGGVGIVGLIIYLAFIAFIVASAWKIYAKAGQPGWAAIIPIYNTYVLTQIVGRPAWWLVLFFIPIVNFIAVIIVMMDLAKSFGKGAGFGLGLVFLSPIFVPILGFGKAQYVGAAAAAGGAQASA